MKKYWVYLVLALCLSGASLTACGVKGDLYLPGEPGESGR